MRIGPRQLPERRRVARVELEHSVELLDRHVVTARQELTVGEPELRGERSRIGREDAPVHDERLLGLPAAEESLTAGQELDVAGRGRLSRGLAARFDEQVSGDAERAGERRHEQEDEQLDPENVHRPDSRRQGSPRMPVAQRGDRGRRPALPTGGKRGRSDDYLIPYRRAQLSQRILRRVVSLRPSSARKVSIARG
jgi:hypothetical protein